MSNINIASLCASFGDAGIAIPRYHDLSLSYPSIDLLPTGKLPHLEVPADITFRERPSVQQYNPTPADVDFVRVMNVPGAQHSLPEDLEPGCIANAISRLRNAPGSSKLDAVAFFGDNGHDVLYRFRLSTTWKLLGGVVNEVKEFELCSAGWEVHRAMEEKDDGMELLDDLMHRRSVRAYFHVLYRLIQYNPDFAKEEEESYSERWELSPYASANQLLARRLKIMNRDSNGLQRRTVDLELHSVSTLWVELPCGHDRAIELDEVRSMSIGQCFQFKCTDDLCGLHVLTEDDEKTIDRQTQKQLRAEYLVDQQQWRQHDREVDDMKEPVGLDGASLLTAIHRARESLFTPESVSPILLEPCFTQELGTVLIALRSVAERVHRGRMLTPAGLLQELRRVAGSALEGAPAPPRLGPMVERILTRAVNFLVEKVKAGGNGMDQIIGNVQEMEL